MLVSASVKQLQLRTATMLAHCILHTVHYNCKPHQMLHIAHTVLGKHCQDQASSSTGLTWAYEKH